MSIKALEWALKSAPVADPLSHLVLIGLADHAGDDGTGAWPSVRKLAEYARCSTRSVQNKLRTLEAAGLIVRGDQRMVTHLPANHRPTVYNLALAGVQEIHPKDALGVNDGTSRGERSGDVGVHAVADKPSNEPSLNRPSLDHSSRADAREGVLEAAWEVFWEMYPRRVGKQDARKAFERAARTVDPETIVDAAARLASDPNLPEKQFIPHPGTWLRQGRWDDEPLPPRARQLTHRDQTMMGELQWAHDYEQQQRHRLEIEA